jgi:hypothetical protein
MSAQMRLLSHQVEVCVVPGMVVSHDQLMHLRWSGFSDSHATERLSESSPICPGTRFRIRVNASVSSDVGRAGRAPRSERHRGET